MVQYGLVGHVDADSFYCSAERVRRPWLRGRPVGVLGNQGAAVIAKSYELKAKGVKTGEPVWDAKRKCPEAVFVKRDFKWYEVLSNAMLDLVRTASPKAEYYSIDEFFFLAPTQKPRLAATDLRDRIHEAARLPVTVGIARTRTLAKLFSDTAKPFGIRAVTDPDEEVALLATMPVSEISGIAGRRAATLAKAGVHTCLDFRRADRKHVRQMLTRTGEALWYELNGERVITLHPERPAHKVISRGGSLGGATCNPHRLYGWLVRNIERLIEELQFYGVKAGKLSALLSYTDGEGGTGRGPLDCPTDRFDRLLEAGAVALRQTYRPAQSATHMHLFAGDLKSGPVQRSLFDQPDPRADAVADVKRRINEAGRFKLRSGATLLINDLYADPTHSFDVCDIKGKTCF